MVVFRVKEVRGARVMGGLVVEPDLVVWANLVVLSAPGKGVELERLAAGTLLDSAIGVEAPASDNGGGAVACEGAAVGSAEAGGEAWAVRTGLESLRVDAVVDKVEAVVP